MKERVWNQGPRDRPQVPDNTEGASLMASIRRKALKIDFSISRREAKKFQNLICVAGVVLKQRVEN